MLVKIHKACRYVVAVCDSDLIGKRFEDIKEGKDVQIDLTGSFFKGDEKTKQETREIIRDMRNEDACFNFVGKESVKLGKEQEVINDSGIIEISGVPVALCLL